MDEGRVTNGEEQGRSREAEKASSEVERALVEQRERVMEKWRRTG